MCFCGRCFLHKDALQWLCGQGLCPGRDHGVPGGRRGRGRGGATCRCSTPPSRRKERRPGCCFRCTSSSSLQGICAHSKCSSLLLLLEHLLLLQKEKLLLLVLQGLRSASVASGWQAQQANTAPTSPRAARPPPQVRRNLRLHHHVLLLRVGCARVEPRREHGKPELVGDLPHVRKAALQGQLLCGAAGGHGVLKGGEGAELLLAHYLRGAEGPGAPGGEGHCRWGGWGGGGKAAAALSPRGARNSSRSSSRSSSSGGSGGSGGSCCRPSRGRGGLRGGQWLRRDGAPRTLTTSGGLHARGSSGGAGEQALHAHALSPPHSDLCPSLRGGLCAPRKSGRCCGAGRRGGRGRGAGRGCLWWGGCL